MSYRTNALINPDDCAFVFIDHQPQMAFGVTSIDRQTLKSNVVVWCAHNSDRCRVGSFLRLYLA